MKCIAFTLLYNVYCIQRSTKNLSTKKQKQSTYQKSLEERNRGKTREREREGEGEGEGEREREIERHTQGEERETDKQKERETERQRERDREYVKGYLQRNSFVLRKYQ